MAKQPRPGHTKTRLVPPLTHEQAASLYEAMLLDIIDRLQARSDCTTAVAVDSPDSEPWFAAAAPGLRQVMQQGEALGDRLDAVLGQCLDLGYEAAVAISSDSPDLPAAHVGAALALIADDATDIVLGPTEDGGYYLIGWKQQWAPVVTEVTMSTPDVLADTLAVAERVGARVGLAPVWYDVDDADDLVRLRADLDPDVLPRLTAVLAELP